MNRFKDIPSVPLSNDLVDNFLSYTNTHTPTVVHPHYRISKIRKFYKRKLECCAGFLSEKLNSIVEGFPVLNDLHPFYKDLISVLYDRNHYKMALGHVKSTIGVVEGIKKEYIRYIKYGSTLRQCKQLKVAAFGRTAKAVKKLKDTLRYLERIRQEMNRLPEVHTWKKSVLITGYPNTGKSSIFKRLTNAKVEVNSYPFTTKAIYVGHHPIADERVGKREDLKRTETIQFLDTPGMFDLDASTKNKIDIQAMLALAHLNSLILYVVDPSETCGYSLSEQMRLYEENAEVFRNSIVVLSKSDIPAEKEDELMNFLRDKKHVEVSSLNNHNIDKLLSIVRENIGQGIAGDEINIVTPTAALKEKVVTRVEDVPPRRNDDISFRVPEIYNGNNVFDFFTATAPEVEVDVKGYDILPQDMREKMSFIKNTIELKRGEHALRKKKRLSDRQKSRRMKAIIVPENRGERSESKSTDECDVVSKKSAQRRRNVFPKRSAIKSKNMLKHLWRGRSKHGNRRHA